MHKTIIGNLLHPKGNAVFLWTVFQYDTKPISTGLPVSVNRPIVGMVLTLCFNEEQGWWGGGSIYIQGYPMSHHCSILLHKVIRGALQPTDYWTCFPHDDTVWWCILTPVRSEYVACFQWRTVQKPQWETVMNTSGSESRLGDRRGEYSDQETFHNNNFIYNVSFQINQLSFIYSFRTQNKTRQIENKTKRDQRVQKWVSWNLKKNYLPIPF